MAMKDIKDIAEDTHEWLEEGSPVLPVDAEERKAIPVYSGFIRYFPKAIVAVTEMSVKGGKQHHPDKPLHWDRSKSADDKDALMRHILEENWPAVAWRAMAVCEKELEKR